MIAADTNVVLRLVLGDDPGQTVCAETLLARGIFVPHGVLMEAEWVLRSAYALEPEVIADALADLIDLASVHVDRPHDLAWALDRYRRGADWPDMLHLIASRGMDGFATFDRELPKRAGASPPVPIELLSA
ncbi:type II toxin-antitoxin system VapC family toxin [Sphingosinicella sp. LHD-64]|uniref:type II toxin-antitoxin system VapC family toxin n=1 Tax=Sphingosinicella sp. LHD-64 TaxID=3072139 RepID=UPI00280CCA00|nr:type II toxin-antitoxin system VapC family toxin [Sphingosinicella sp. LHD-64]MDQ8756732.1 type II toxin-antitoxin system VapC family toxin [Sphingosinicella sp. LHD-64]